MSHVCKSRTDRSNIDLMLQILIQDAAEQIQPIPNLENGQGTVMNFDFLYVFRLSIAMLSQLGL